ncbi:MAG TPA: hypothetical protein VH088_19140, partial [Terriglobales bacterium]|nr:hypothetical protein [Terriglobales bacterium]
SLIGSFASFSLGLRLRKFRVSQTPPKSRAGLSREERQQKITTGRRICCGLGVFMLVATFFFAWLANPN